MYFILSLQKHRVFVKGLQNNLQTSKTTAPSSFWIRRCNDLIKSIISIYDIGSQQPSVIIWLPVCYIPYLLINLINHQLLIRRMADHKQFTSHAELPFVHFHFIAFYFRFRILEKWQLRAPNHWTQEQSLKRHVPFASNLSRLQGICRVITRFVTTVCHHTFCPRVNLRRSQWVSRVHFVDNLYPRLRFSESQINGQNSFL